MNKDIMRYMVAAGAIKARGWDYGLKASNGLSVMRALELAGPMGQDTRDRVCQRIMVACGCRRYGSGSQQLASWERDGCTGSAMALRALRIAEKLAEIEGEKSL